MHLLSCFTHSRSFIVCKEPFYIPHGYTHTHHLNFNKLLRHRYITSTSTPTSSKTQRNELSLSFGTIPCLAASQHHPPIFIKRTNAAASAVAVAHQLKYTNVYKLNVSTILSIHHTPYTYKYKLIYVCINHHHSNGKKWKRKFARLQCNKLTNESIFGIVKSWSCRHVGQISVKSIATIVATNTSSSIALVLCRRPCRRCSSPKDNFLRIFPDIFLFFFLILIAHTSHYIAIPICSLFFRFVFDSPFWNNFFRCSLETRGNFFLTEESAIPNDY